MSQPDLSAALQRSLDDQTEVEMRRRRVYYRLEAYDEFVDVRQHRHTPLWDSVESRYSLLREKYPETAWFFEEATPEQKERVLNGEPIAHLRAGL
jgi:hypothetical protein